KLDVANRDFQTLIGGPPGQLLPPPPSSNNSATSSSGGPTPSASSTPAAPPGLLPHAPKSTPRQVDEQRRSSVKRQRTMSEPAEEQVVAANLTAEVDMVVEDAIPAVEVNQTRSKISKTLPFHDYDIYEESGEPADNHHIFKWGVVVGVRKDIQVAQRVEITQRSLKGRVVAIDIILPTLDGGFFGHRIIGAYAPWNPGGAGNVRLFWDDVAQLCLSSPTSWTMAGDFNATISSLERASGGADAREQYRRFIQIIDGHDLWSDNDERSRSRDWTCRGHGSQMEGNIIDRIVTSKLTLVDAGIFVADRHNDFIPFTDHRAIVGQLSHSSPMAVTASSSSLFGPPSRRSAMLSHVKVPLKQEKVKYDFFCDKVDTQIKAECIGKCPVIDDESFTRRYKELSSVLKKVSEEVFGRTTPFVKQQDDVTNKQIKDTVRELRAVGGAIHLEKFGQTARISLKATHVYHLAAAEFQLDPGSSETLLHFLTRRRRLLHKRLFAERSKEIILRAKLFSKNQIYMALRGGSTKKLVQSYPFIPLPLVVNDLDSPQKLICDPEGVKSTTRKYFTRLYDHSGIPELPKLWLTTPSVVDVKDRVTNNPFLWPRSASLMDFRALLRRGNNRPSPGPDGWEKWIIKSLSDDALNLVLDLHNYQVMNSRFPGDIKDMWLTMFHKRDVRTNLSNWRGLLLSNVLANSPMAWLNCSLIQYSSEKRILPDTQVAAQPGVQTRDLMSFLASVKYWATRHKEPVYALKRDQIKGFDYLAPEGFHDAIRSYGLPESIIDIDKAAQKDTKCFIRTAYGVTVPIVVSDVNKQGGPLSPIKSTFTTSLGHYYLNDLM
ncbi:hypothetical protein K443DRAFT_11320, partial [Laccaria amethystina LaAM-08-1]